MASRRAIIKDIAFMLGVGYLFGREIELFLLNTGFNAVP